MKIKRELLQLAHVADGKCEPEEVAARRLYQGSTGVSLQGGAEAGGIPLQIEAPTTAGEIAAQQQRPCTACAHFDNKCWLATKRAWESGDIERRKDLNRIRFAIVGTGNAAISNASEGADGDLDVEHAVNMLGVCRAMTQANGDAVIVHPLGGCPDTVCGPTQPHGFFSPKDSDVERHGAKLYDAVMQQAQRNSTAK